MDKNPETLTPKTVAKLIGINTELLKTWCNEFNVQAERTEGGHRRFTKENVEEIKAIKEKIQSQGWSYDQVRAWRNGEIDAFVEKEEKSNLEKKIDLLLEQAEMQNQFNQFMAQKLDEALTTIGELKKENESLHGSLREHDRLLIEGLRESTEKKREEKRRKGFGFFRLLELRGGNKNGDSKENWNR